MLWSVANRYQCQNPTLRRRRVIADDNGVAGVTIVLSNLSRTPLKCSAD